MTGTQMARLIGRNASYRPNRFLNFEVTILDARMRFGTVDVLIGPKAGNGTQWVEIHSITVEENH